MKTSGATKSEPIIFLLTKMPVYTYFIVIHAKPALKLGGLSPILGKSKKVLPILVINILNKFKIPYDPFSCKKTLVHNLAEWPQVEALKQMKQRLGKMIFIYINNVQEYEHGKLF